MSKTQQQLWTKFGGKEFFARMAENAKNDGEGNEISQTYATKDTATSSTAGLMSGADKAKLDAIGQGAEANVIESISANGVALQVSGKNVDIPVATDQTDGLLPHEKLALIPAAAQPGADRVYSFDDANGTSWQTVVKDYFGDLVLDQTGTPVSGEDGSLLYSEDAVQLWLSYKGTEFGARRAYEDHTGENIHDSIAAKPDMTQVNAAIETALANYGGFQVVNIGDDGKPDVDDPSTKYIYLTKDEQSQVEDPYTEWIYTVENQWEKIGETSVNLVPMTGATAQSDGESGLVPKPLIADKDKFLKGDGTWAAPPEVNLSAYYYDKNGNGLSARRTSGVQPYGTTSLVGGSGNVNSYNMDTTFYLDWNGYAQSLFKVNTGDSGLSYIGFGINPENDAARRYLLPKPVAGKCVTADSEGKIQWSQNTWTDGDYTIPPASTVTIGGREYVVVTIGNQQWMAENLDYKFSGCAIGEGISASEPRANYYQNNEATYGDNGNRYGLLYNWIAVNYLETHKDELLPSGWHVPSKTEWDTLIAEVGGASVAGTKLKSTTGWSSGNGDGTYGFDAYPAGQRNKNSSFMDVGYNAYFWTATSSQVISINTGASTSSWPDNNACCYSVRLVRTLA